MICHHCKTEFKLEGRALRSDECPNCGYDVHSCLNCANYDVSSHNRCREPQAEWVSDRERANFCDYFDPNQLKAGARPAVDARKSFDDLFKT